MPLDVREAAGELGTRRAQRGLGVDAQLARQVDDDEQQVAELLASLRVVVGRGELARLLGDLVEDALDRGQS